jgi:hypothetical protein
VVDGEEAGAQFVHLVAVGGLTHHGDFDLGGGAADLGAVLSEDAEFAFEGFGVGEAVPDVGVLGREAQGLLLASAADQNRDLAGGQRVQTTPSGTRCGGAPWLVRQPPFVR